MKLWKWALLAAAMLAAKGLDLLPQGREMESMKLVSALAVDGGAETTVTAVTAVRTTEDEEPEVFTGAGDSLTAACAALRENSSRRTYLGQTEQLLLGEGQDPARALEFAADHRELRLDTLLYIVKGPAGPALAASAQRTAGETGGADPKGRTIGQVMPRLAEGDHTLVPALAADGEGQLSPAGWAVLGQEGVAGWLEGDAALGAALLGGVGQGQAATLNSGSAELVSARCWAKDGAVCCALSARATEGEPTAGELEAWGEEKLRSALAAGWDCWGLRRELAVPRPWDWETLKDLDIRTLDVKVTGKLVGQDG